MTDNALKCKYNGGRLPVGYFVDINQYFKLNPLMSPLVLEAFTNYAEGMTIRSIVDILNERLLTNRGQAMSINSVTRMLKNRHYIG